MLSTRQQAYIKECARLATWRSIRNSVTVFVTVPAGYTVWHVSDIEEINLMQIGVVLSVVIAQAFSASRVATHRTRVQLMSKVMRGGN